MGLDWFRYWRELDEELDRPEDCRNEGVRRLAEDLALAIHKREVEVLEGSRRAIEMSDRDNCHTLSELQEARYEVDRLRSLLKRSTRRADLLAWMLRLRLEGDR